MLFQSFKFLLFFLILNKLYIYLTENPISQKHTERGKHEENQRIELFQPLMQPLESFSL